LIENREEKFNLAHFHVDANYIEVLDLKLLAGENLPENPGSGGEKYIVLNQAAVERFGFENHQSALGQAITVDDSLILEIVGIIEDYHFFGMFSKIGPMGLRYDESKFGIAHLSISSSDIPSTMRKLEKAWKKVDPERDLKAKFMDAEIREYYSMFGDILWMVGFTSLLAIIIACMGLFGMAAYSTESRIKEIGIRKAMGARSTSIAYLISRSYVKLIGIAILIALPLSYFGNNLWLQEFAYKVNFGAGSLIFGAIFIIVVSFLTISTQTMRAAIQDPVNSLRYE